MKDKYKKELVLNKRLDTETYALITGLARTRRMKRDVSMLYVQGDIEANYGVEGEFYFEPNDFSNNGQKIDDSILDYNTPPGCQPDLWLFWIPANDGCSLIWEGPDDSDYILDWIAYLIQKIFEPREYVLNGKFQILTEIGLETIEIKDNHIVNNGKPVVLDEVLLNIMMKRMQHSNSSNIKGNKIIKMEMSPDQKWAIEIEDKDGKIVAVLSRVINGASLEPFKIYDLD
ncbi:hypothetical protein [Paenibacillus durus]|uniref:Uncharacterized protein n=1 Tax=Paenibacillus durus ATCC 35681 TaxID=1333534 RepID=A0A0F7FD75_PAEDU|nr:hypothetical protein [Paenibacillus durus]AKG36403.1 hypothetical protein VK70_19165 [Paenibacillus durus ATCC 35681]